MGDPAKQQGRQQDIERKQSMRSRPHDQAEPGPHDSGPESKQHAQQNRRLQEGEPERNSQSVGPLAQRGNDDEQRNDREVLKEQHTEHPAAVLRLEFTSLDQQLDDQRSRREGKRCRDREGQTPVEAPGKQPARPRGGQYKQDRHDQRSAAQDLRAAQAEHKAAQDLQPRQAEFEPQGEHQKDDTKLSRSVEHALVVEQFGGVGRHAHPDGQIGHQRRDTESPEGQHHEGRRGDQNQGELEA